MDTIVKASWKGKSKFEAETPGGTITMSASEDGGLGPKALMLDALVGCTGIDIIFLIDKMRLKVSDVKLEATAKLTEEHPKYYDKVKVTYHFFGDELDKTKLEKAVNLSAEKYCGVMEMFRQFSEIEIEIKYN